MRELLLEVDYALGRRVGIERALRDAIRSGVLPAGSRLPSTRALAADQGLARATVVAAYEQLVIEGYLTARQGAGTTVADLPVVERRGVANTTAAANPAASTRTLVADFRPGEPDIALFPRSAWLRSLRRAVTNASFGYGDPLGSAELRVALAEYLGRSRGVATDPAGISIFGGVTASFGFLGELFGRLGVSRVAIEDPCLFLLRDVLSLVGVTCVPVPLDSEGIDVAALAACNVGAVVVTPGHQYPMGITMSAKRRAELVAWACQRETWIVEDDYDGEFRYDRQPIGAVQGLDPDRVIYAGTASKMLAPGLRLSWLVVPTVLRSQLASIKHLRAGVSSLDQLALADFMTRGELDRHLRSARQVYQYRQQVMVQALSQEAPWLELSPSVAGLHLTGTFLRTRFNEAELVAKAAEQGIGLLGLGPHWTGKRTCDGLVIGYSRPAQHHFSVAVERLIQMLRPVAA